MIDRKKIIITHISGSEIGFKAKNVKADDVLPKNFFDSELADSLHIAELEDVELNLTVWYRIEKNGVLTPFKLFEVVGDEGIGYMSSVYQEFIEQIDWRGFPTTDENIIKKAKEEAERLEKIAEEARSLIAKLNYIKFGNDLADIPLDTSA